jgi:PilZ domain
MESDKRNTPRTAAKGLKAKIIITHSNRSIMIADVNLLDVSRSGIKFRMKKPLAVDVGTKIQLEIILPDSGIPVILDAVVVHEKFESEFGLHYIDVRPEDPLSELIRQCENRLSWTE